MKAIFIALLTFLLLNPVYAQDSVKIERKILLQIQKWPDFYSSGFSKPFQADSTIGLWLMLWGIEDDTTLGKVKLYYRIKDNLARIKVDPDTGNVVYITPNSKKLKSANQRFIELEIWCRFEWKNIYFPFPQNDEWPHYDKYARIIPDNIKWEPLSKKYLFKNGKYRLSHERFHVSLD